MSSYSRNQIDFIMNLKKQGKTVSEIVIAFGKKYGIKKSSDAISHAIHRYKADYDLSSVKSIAEVKAEVVKETILADLLKAIQTRKYVPIATEFHRIGTYSKDAINKHFGSFEELVSIARDSDPKTFESIIDETSFNDESFRELRKYVSEANRFVITTAVTGCEPHADALSAIETYCNKVGASLLILPCSDPAKQREHKNKWSLSHKLPKEAVVFKDLPLNNNIGISTIKMSAKQLQPLTGIKRLNHKRGSTIVASPKQFLEFAANSNNNSEIPRALMSTGAITKPQYRTDMYMSERTAYLAEQDHVLGAIIVEIKNGNIFFFRQIQFEPKTGAFCDLNKKYYPNGKIETITASLIQTGDWHTLSTCPESRNMAKELTELLKPDYLTFEDFFDGITINPHERHNLVALSKKAKIGLLNLDHELQSNRDEINEVCKWPAKQIIMKYGNHEDFLKRWISDGEFMNEPLNKVLGMKLNIAMEEQDAMPLEFAMREMYKLDSPDKVRFLELNESFKVNGIENGAHGHLGKGGRRNPGMAEVEECYGPANIGHNHSSAIFRSVYRAGTTSHLQLSYNDGPSAWTQSHVIQHHNGSRQLIHNIYGQWCLE